MNDLLDSPLDKRFPTFLAKSPIYFEKLVQDPLPYIVKHTSTKIRYLHTFLLMKKIVKHRLPCKIEQNICLLIELLFYLGAYYYI